jgi:hypothetical protein
LLKDNVDLALKLMRDFKNTQHKKKRQNIDHAFRKLSQKQPLNHLEKEALSELRKFVQTYNYQ